MSEEFESLTSHSSSSCFSLFINDFKASSSIGRAAVSKTAGWGFDSLLACQRVRGGSGSVPAVIMNGKAETQDRRNDSLKLGFAILLMGAGIYGFYYFADVMVVFRVLALLAVAGVSMAIAYRTGVGRQVVGFISGAHNEVRRMVWPNRAETVQTTMVVIFIVLVVGVFLWLLDMVLLRAVQILTGQGS
jgi:preprotein translocase subunit SecE